MADYRIFFLGRDGRIASAQVVSCESDIEAMAIAGTIEHCHGIEVWHYDRRIGDIKASDFATSQNDIRRAA
jgi:hypothetical protein